MDGAGMGFALAGRLTISRRKVYCFSRRVHGFVKIPGVEIIPRGARLSGLFGPSI
jgi:hypothetical protein